MKLLQKIIELFRPSNIMYHEIKFVSSFNKIPKLKGIRLSDNEGLRLKCNIGYKYVTEMDLSAIHESIVHEAKKENNDIIYIRIPLEIPFEEFRRNIIPMGSEIHFAISKCNKDNKYVVITIQSLSHDILLEDLIKDINLYKAVLVLDNRYFVSKRKGEEVSPINLDYNTNTKKFFKEKNIILEVFNSDLETIYISYNN